MLLGSYRLVACFRRVNGMLGGCDKDATKMLVGFYENVSRKLLPWNLAFTAVPQYVHRA